MLGKGFICQLPIKALNLAPKLRPLLAYHLHFYPTFRAGPLLLVPVFIIVSLAMLALIDLLWLSTKLGVYIVNARTTIADHRLAISASVA